MWTKLCQGGGVVRNLARLLGNPAELGVAGAQPRSGVREVSAEAIRLNVKISMYLHIPNGVRPAEVCLHASDCMRDTFQRLTPCARRPAGLAGKPAILVADWLPNP